MKISEFLGKFAIFCLFLSKLLLLESKINIKTDQNTHIGRSVYIIYDLRESSGMSHHSINAPRLDFFDPDPPPIALKVIGDVSAQN